MNRVLSVVCVEMLALAAHAHRINELRGDDL